MLNKDDLKRLLNLPNISRKHAVLLILAFDECSFKTVSAIKATGKANGLRSIEKWNISQILKDLKSNAVRLEEGWEISPIGLQELAEAELLTSDDWSGRFMGPAGITGLWQVELRGKGGKMSEEERKGLDNQYDETYSFWGGIKLILRTIPVLLQKENV